MPHSLRVTPVRNQYIIITYIIIAFVQWSEKYPDIVKSHDAIKLQILKLLRNKERAWPEEEKTPYFKQQWTAPEKALFDAHWPMYSAGQETKTHKCELMATEVYQFVLHTTYAIMTFNCSLDIGF